MRILLLIPMTIVPLAGMAEDSGVPAWPSDGRSWGAPGMAPMPQPPAAVWPETATDPLGTAVPGFIPWAPQGSGGPGAAPWSGTSPDAANLSGTWRGSGGELVEIRRNWARVWGTDRQYCHCLFMVHGDRLIAYSPDTDVVRKYQFLSERDRFVLRDENGQTMLFERIR